jgi:thiol-disulfide isomerase/thioredoxin
VASRWSRWVLTLLAAVGLVVVPVSLSGVGSQLAAATESPAETATDAPVVIELFYSATCPHCHAEIEWLQGFLADHPDVAVQAYEVTGSAANRDLFSLRGQQLGFTPRSVPTTIIGDVYWSGFSQDVAAQIEAVVLAAVAPESLGPAEVPTEIAGGQVSTIVDVPLIGTVDMGDQSLLVATLAIGFLDGVNPCSLWVLSMLLALVVHTRSRRRVLAVGTVFLTVTTALYGVYMLGIYSVLATMA